jgi:hypothetical protein
MPTRTDVIAKLVRLSGPVGPFRSFEALLREKDEWLAAAEPSLVGTLLDILLDPPSDVELASARREDFDGELGEALAHVGARDPIEFLARVRPHLDAESARPTLIEAIGALGRPEGTEALAPLVDDPRLSGDERVRLAGALGEIGTPEARRLLNELRARYAGAAPELDREIEVALQLAGENPR